MTNPYNHPGYENPTEEQARELEMAFILWQAQQARNELRALSMPADTQQDGLDKLRAKLTSPLVRLYKWWDVTRALALGWWHQLTPKEKGCIADGTATAVICIVVIVVFTWLSLR